MNRSPPRKSKLNNLNNEYDSILARFAQIVGHVANGKSMNNNQIQFLSTMKQRIKEIKAEMKRINNGNPPGAPTKKRPRNNGNNGNNRSAQRALRL